MNPNKRHKDSLRWHERFIDKIAITDNCWIYRGHITSQGYGRIHIGKTSYLVHRLMFIEKYGEIPRGLVLDHLCRNRACINPDHLEMVTNLENIKRGIDGEWNRIKTHCPQGHEYNKKNTHYKIRTNRRGFNRVCRLCSRNYMRRKRANGYTR